MIIGGTRIKTGDAEKAISYVMNHGEPTVLCGDGNIGREAEIRANISGGKYALRHWYLSPNTDLSKKELKTAVNMLMAEFEVGNRPAFIVRHNGRRSDGSSVPHFHILTTEHNELGKVLCSKHSWARHEKVSRSLEVILGHSVTTGRHNSAVIAALDRQGHSRIASTLKSTDKGCRPKARWSRQAVEKAARIGLNLTNMEQEFGRLTALRPSVVAQTLAQMEQSYGVRFQEGTKRAKDRSQPIIITDPAGGFIASLNRAFQIPLSNTPKILEALHRAREQVSQRSYSSNSDQPTEVNKVAEAHRKLPRTNGRYGNSFHAGKSSDREAVSNGKTFAGTSKRYPGGNLSPPQSRLYDNLGSSGPIAIRTTDPFEALKLWSISMQSRKAPNA